MAGGLWVHRIDRCGGPAAIIDAAIGCDADRVICKSRDGRAAYNDPDIAPLASGLMAAGIPLWIWAWPYSTHPDGELGYIEQQARKITDDARRLGAVGIVLNIEAPFSWGHGHRWHTVHAEQYGSKSARKIAIRRRTRDLLVSVRGGAGDARIAVSTFPIPSSHATASDIMAQESDEIWPQCYFKGHGWESKIGKAAKQWAALGATVVRFTGPGWRGPTKARSMAAAVRDIQGLDAPIDWWVLDKMDAADLEAAAAIMGGQCPATS